METLIYFALWAGLLFLMMRSGCGTHAHRRPTGNGAGGEAMRDHDRRRLVATPEKDIDPVCGTLVRTASARTSVHEGIVYHFCSRDCREIFEAAPQLYLGEREHSIQPTEHSHA